MPLPVSLPGEISLLNPAMSNPVMTKRRGRATLRAAARWTRTRRSEEAPMPVVDSTAIQRIDYDAEARQLRITFTGGNTYKYYHVSRGVYESFMHAESKGLFFNTYIRDRYDFALATAA
jgi:hypothetical protein